MPDPSDQDSIPITQRKLILEQVTAPILEQPTPPGEDRVNYGEEVNEDERIAKLDQ